MPKGNPKIVLLSHDNYTFTAFTAALSVMGKKNVEEIKDILAEHYPLSLVNRNL